MSSITKKSQLDSDQIELNEFIDGMKHSLDLDKMMIDTGAMPKERKRAYNQILSGKLDEFIFEVNERVKADNMFKMGTQFSTEMAQLIRPENNISKIALAIANNTVIIWAEVRNWEAEQFLYAVENKINVLFKEKHIRIDTQVSHVDDECDVPFGFNLIYPEGQTADVTA